MSATRREKPAYGILWSEISLMGSVDNAIGRFVAEIEPSALTARALVATVACAGSISIGIGVHTAQKELVILLGGVSRHSRKVYILPDPVPEHDGGHELDVAFIGWQITSVQMNGIQLQEDGISVA